MPESKHIKWADSLGTDTDDDAKAKDATLDAEQPAANDSDGWKQYRQWVSKAPTTRRRRSGIDPSLYSWKGYRAWSDHVKRNWSTDADPDD